MIMRKILLGVIIAAGSLFGQGLKPYILIAESELGIADAAKVIDSLLVQNEFDVLGEYQPAHDPSRYVIIFSASELVAAVQEVGGLTGFAAALRIGITSNDNGTRISCVNPIYQANAYFRKDYPKVAEHYQAFFSRFQRAMTGLGVEQWTEFGAKEGIEPAKLQKYNYMFGMEHFDDVVKLNALGSFDEAVAMLEGNLAAVENVELVYSIAIPGKQLKLYGVALGGSTGEGHFLPIIDISTPRHTAFLPYEVLVSGSEIVMLHGRFRIAQSFPDLTMMTFSKIMSTPGAIKRLLQGLAE